jgi:predicted ATP-grasp superfamily ATP-dependent carboligase
VIVLPDSGREPTAFVEGVRAAVERNDYTALIAGTDRDMLVLAREHQRLGALGAGIPQMKDVLRITNKSAVYALSADAGLLVPETIDLRSHASRDLPEMDLPLIVKPERSVVESATGELMRFSARRVASRKQMQDVVAALDGEPWLAQPYIPGRLGAISGVAWEGQLLCAVHQLAHRIWPVTGGISAYAETISPDTALEEGVARLIGRLGWSGIFEAQFIHARDGAYLIDLNPRIYGSISLAVRAGANLPAIWTGLLTRSVVLPARYQVGVRYRHDELDMLALVHLLSTGQLTAAIRGLIPHRRTAHSVASLSDPWPLLTSLSKAWRRRAALNRI